MESLVLLKGEIENYFLKGNPVLKFKERVWGIWSDDYSEVDLKHYSFPDVMQLMSEDTSVIFFSNKAIEYYDNGVRKIVDVPMKVFMLEEHICCSNIKNGSRKTWRNDEYVLASYNKIYKIFAGQREQLCALRDKYPKVNFRFAVNSEFDAFCLATPMKAEILRKKQLSEFYLNESSLGNLQPLFNGMANILQQKQMDEYEKRFGDLPVFFAAEKHSVKLYVGYTDIPYSIAVNSVADVKELNAYYLTHDSETVSISVSGRVLDLGDCTSEAAFDDRLGCAPNSVCVLPPEVYYRWGAEFSEEEKAILQDKSVKSPYLDAENVIKSAKRQWQKEKMKKLFYCNDSFCLLSPVCKLLQC